MRQSTRFFSKLATATALLLALNVAKAFGFTGRSQNYFQPQCGASKLAVAALTASEQRDDVGTDSISPSVQTDRFHQDMKRVLESRPESNLVIEMAEKSALERRRRPEILEDDKDGVQRVLTMLNRMIQLGIATEETFQIAMRACLKRKRLRWRNKEDSRQIVCAADQLEELVNQLRPLTSNISVETYQLVLEAYATCSTPRGGRNYARKADSLLRIMQEEGVFGMEGVENVGEDDLVPPEIVAHVLHAWSWQQANRQPGDCATKANQYLEQLEALSERDPIDPAILLQCYDWCLEAWSKSGSPGSNLKADQVFARMKSLNQTQSESSILDTETYTNAILSWSKCRDPGSAERAHELLVEMLQLYKQGAFVSTEPELIAFNGVITAWAKVGKPEKAREALRLMEDILSRCKNLVPDVVSYNTVLHAHVMSPNKKKALKEIRTTVQYLEENCIEQPAISPDSFTYNTLMKAWIRSGEPGLAEQSEQTLRKMEMLWHRGDDKCEPTNRHYNVVINAYAKSSDPFAGKKAYDLLQRMKGGSFRSKPDIISYTSVIESYSKSADPDAAEMVLELLEEAFSVHEQTGDPSMRPNLRTFTMVILTLANCGGSIVKARGLLTRLLDLYEETKDEALLPNAYPYNYVLNCAANTLEDKAQAFKLATQTYQEMRQSPYVSPDSYTYAFWFKCCNNLLSDKELKGKCLFYAFDECRREGFVSNTVLNRLQRATPPKVLSEWLDMPLRRKTGFRDLTTAELPPEWSRNC
ncbi:Pentatricopeptide repeat-containing protein [Seminavis robusta]|uniref:Pentatricopeptide repeat-containing protein n=1 Tax=Seminavis robusta TaxID=568900 RepID=A0A9N8DBZ3_9STRA|nr:Pentatricopeptide repeat-containing protein [Seminavis robusta]|eukprot:Sro78_g042430.1 Pentatricopeptide repeat-containing protein (758) ;mRNA; r:57038-59519